MQTPLKNNILFSIDTEKDINGVTFKISKGYSQLISNEELVSIAKDYQEDEEILITIEEIGYAEEDFSSNGLITPMWNDYVTTYGSWGNKSL